MYSDLSHIGFSTYYMDLTTQIGLDTTEGKKDGLTALCMCMDNNISG